MNVDVLQRSPIRPDLKTVRTVLASVFNIDYKDNLDLPIHQLVVVLAYKVLLDTGHESDHLIQIFRFCRTELESWDQQSPAMLSISNGTLAILFFNKTQTCALNFRSGVEVATAPEPVFQLSVNLRALSALLVSSSERPY